MEIITIQRKNHPCLVIPTKVKDLDLTKCSPKFLEHDFDGEMIVYVKCHEDGSFDLRGKKEEYRIIPEDQIK